MDFRLKQWKDQQHESDPPSAKLPRLGFDEQQPPSASSSHALPWAVPELTNKLSNLSAFPPDSTPLPTRCPRMGSYFSLSQWQELELQALIFRHMLAGLAVPPELLHLLNKTLLTTSPYYLHPYPHYQPALLQSGYWGRGGMDPEPGRCRRTDGKKWRCSRDVVAGHKYCERHMHRGRNRSRKPVETPTSTAAGATAGGSGQLLKNPLTAMAGGTHLALSGPSPSIDLLHLSQRSSEVKTENKYPYEPQHEASGDSKPGDRVLRHFFDDWPKSLKEHGNTRSPVASATSLTISMPGNSSSDISLKLSTGNRDEPGIPPDGSNPEQARTQFNWAAGWAANQVAPMGGPLAEALRSSASNSSPTSVLRRSSTSDTSYVSTST